MLNYFIRNNNEEMVDLIINYGAIIWINISVYEKLNPLMAAIKQNSLKFILKFIKLGAKFKLFHFIFIIKNWEKYSKYFKILLCAADLQKDINDIFKEIRADKTLKINKTNLAEAELYYNQFLQEQNNFKEYAKNK